jgi:hypothetical protein
LTLFESVISVVIVGLMLVAALNTVGAARLGRYKMNLRRQGHLLAASLMSEILQQEYLEPDYTEGQSLTFDAGGILQLPPGVSLGPDDGETDGTRKAFDDVDDYHGWSASPPADKQGTVIPGLNGWARSVKVALANPADLSLPALKDRGAKQIVVTVTNDGATVAELVAVKSVGLPPPEENSLTVLLVVTDAANLTSQEAARQTLMESWDFAVTLIDASASQTEFDEAVASVDVAYISDEVVASQLSTKLKNAVIGVVNEEELLVDDFGFCSATTSFMGSTDVELIDDTNYITSPFGVGPLTVLTSASDMHATSGTLAGGAQVLATDTSGGDGAVVLIEAGGALYGGGTAADRRVHLMWGGSSFDIGLLNGDGRTVTKRAVEWAAGMGGICGDASCDGGEGSCDCPADCGDPASFEEPGVSCDDGVDNDCDGQADCDDMNCLSDPACAAAVCGNGICESGETTTNCAEDCPPLHFGE